VCVMLVMADAQSQAMVIEPGIPTSVRWSRVVRIIPYMPPNSARYASTSSGAPGVWLTSVNDSEFGESMEGSMVNPAVPIPSLKEPSVTAMAVWFCIPRRSWEKSSGDWITRLVLHRGSVVGGRMSKG
jgi:hypothetical protein